MRTRENFPVGHPSQIAPSQARLTWRFFRDRLPKKKMHLVGMITLLILLSLGPGHPIPGARISQARGAVLQREEAAEIGDNRDRSSGGGSWRSRNLRGSFRSPAISVCLLSFSHLHINMAGKTLVRSTQLLYFAGKSSPPFNRSLEFQYSSRRWLEVLVEVVLFLYSEVLPCSLPHLCACVVLCSPDYCPPWPGAWAPCCAVFVFSGWCRGRLTRPQQRL
jgi:hypothetical protein